MIWFGLGILVGLAAGIPLHFRLTRKQYAAFMSACAQLRRERRIRERQRVTIQRIQGMLDRSRGRGYGKFGGPVALPIAAESMGRQRKVNQ